MIEKKKKFNQQHHMTNSFDSILLLIFLEFSITADMHI